MEYLLSDQVEVSSPLGSSSSLPTQAMLSGFEPQIFFFFQCLWQFSSVLRYFSWLVLCSCMSGPTVLSCNISWSLRLR